MYLLDTNVLSALRRPERARKVADWLDSKPEDELYLSVITLGEIERGIVQQTGRDPGFAAALRSWIERTVSLFADRLLPFGHEEARIWGRLSAELGNSGADRLIAATALARGAVVVTGNTADFRPTGVKLEDPF